MKELTIAGAGVAGLALGNALQRAGIATTIHEAGILPRHRVCGEFICGRGAAALQQLGLADSLHGALLHRKVHWYLKERCILKSTLPSPAYGISRYALDQRLAETFQTSGGMLLEHSRVADTAESEGVIYCSGRKASKSDWMGLKFHCTTLVTLADLELHLGNDAYLGMSAIEDGRVNVCALFKKRPELKASRKDLLLAYLDGCGLSSVSQRLQTGGIDPKSHSGVAGICFSSEPERQSPKLSLGDAYSVIPPFTGNGMSMALESAAIAFPELLAYSKGAQNWDMTLSNIQRVCLAQFDIRLRAAKRLHPWISESKRQQILAVLCRLHLLPFQLLYSKTH